MQKILLQTVKALLDKADDIWIYNQSGDCCLTPNSPPEDTFLEIEYEDAAGLLFNYKAFGDDNEAVTLNGDTLTLVGREDDGETYDFAVKLLKRWDAEAYLGEGAQ